MQKWSWKWLIVVGLIITLFAYLFYSSDRPPLQEIIDARMKIAEAERLNSGKYAIAPLKKAHLAYDSAMYKWRLENEKLFFMRKFASVRSCAIQASGQAELAAQKSANSVIMKAEA